MLPEDEVKKLTEAITKSFRYADGIHRAAQEQEKLARVMKDVDEMRKKNIATMREEKKESRRLEVAAADLARKRAKTAEERKKADEDYKRKVKKFYGTEEVSRYEKTVLSSLQKQHGSVEKLTKAQKAHRKEYEKLSGVNLSGLKKAQAELFDAFTSKKTGKSIDEIADKYQNVVKSMQDAAKRTGQEGPEMPSAQEALRTGFLAAAKSREKTMEKSSGQIVDSLIDELRRASSEAEEMEIMEKALDIEGATKALEQMKLKYGKASFFTESGKAVGGAAKSLFKGDQGGFQHQAKNMQEWATAAKASGKKLGFLGKNIGSLADFLGKLGKLNWIFTLISALGKMISIFNDLDKYVKGLNQQFLTMAGPAGALENAEASMVEFNRAIHDLQRNMELGLLPKEVQAFFGAVSGAGLSLQGIMQSVGNYGDVIEEGRKMSLEFGVSMEDMGKMISTQMLELRASLTDVSDGFEKISYDAAMAGVSSNKFYNAIESTALSLEFYGNSLKYVSGLLADIKKTGRIGFKGAEDLAKSYTEMFEGMDLTKKISLIEMVGVDQMRSIFEEIGKRADKQLQNLNNQIKVMTAEGKDLTEEDKKRLEALREQQKNLRHQVDYYDEIAKSGDRGRMAEGLSGAAAAGFAPYLIQTIMQRLGPGLIGGGEGETVARKTIMGSLLSIDPKHIDQTEEILRVFYRTFDELNKKALRLSQQFLIGDETMRNLLLEARESGKGFDQLKPELFKKLVEANKDLFENEEELNAFVKNLIDAVSDNINLLLKPGITGEEYAEGAFAQIGTMTRGTAGLSGRGMDELVRSVTPLEKMLNITQDSLKYELADNLIFRSMNNWLHDIFELLKFIGKIMPKGKSYEEMQADKEKKFLKEEFEMYAVAQDKAAQAIMAISEKQGRLEGEEDPKKIKLLKEEISAEEEKLKLAKEQMSEIESTSGRGRDLAATSSVSISELIRRLQEGTIQRGERSRLSFLQDRILEGLGRDPKDRSFQDLLPIEKGYYDLLGSREDKQNFLYRKHYNPEAKTSPENRNKVLDYRADTSGWVNISRGDIVVNSGSLAKGIKGGVGQFAHQVMAKSNIGGIGGSQHNWGGINIVFQAPADSTNPNAYKRMFVDAVEQIVDRKLYAEKQRIS